MESKIREKIEAIQGARMMLKILQDNRQSFNGSDFIQLEEPDFPGRIGPKNFTILLNTVAGILLGDVPTYNTHLEIMLNPPIDQ